MMLFVYGTLMDDALVHQLTGRSFRTEPAVLAGYRRCVPAGGYPYIVPDAAASVQGRVLHDVDTAALRIFDDYEDEGRLYRRTEVVVTLGDIPGRVMTYVGVPSAHRAPPA
jgi:gamma-glutamylcyclotransferase (GGCT)/AIG2-like uncharacterized protein YtfP